MKKLVVKLLSKFYQCGQVCYAGAALTAEKVVDFMLKLGGIL